MVHALALSLPHLQKPLLLSQTCSGDSSLILKQLFNCISYLRKEHAVRWHDELMQSHRDLRETQWYVQ